MMIVAICENCRTLFPSGIVAGFGTRVGLSGNTSQCPRCGQMAPILEGQFEIVEDAIRILEADEFNARVVQVMNAELAKLKSGGATRASAVRTVREVSPPAGAAFDRWLTHGMAFTTMMLTLIGVLLAQCEGGANSSNASRVDDAFDQSYEEIVTRQRQEPDSTLAHPQQVRYDPVEHRTGRAPHTENRKRRRAIAANQRKISNRPVKDS